MTVFDEKLQQLQAQVARSEKLRAVVAELYQRIDQLSDRERELSVIRAREQADVDKLEGRTLAAFFCGLTGNKEERLEKERQEARAAAVKHDAVMLQLQEAQAELEARHKEWKSLDGCEARYQEALREKAQAVKNTDPVRGAEILRLEEEIGRLDQKRIELTEAIQAGRQAQDQAERVMAQLDSAESWGTWDVLGGGMLADIAKYDHLDRAQSEVEQLQLCLNRFKSELADVTIYADMQVQIDDFLRFADWFFDGLFADWAVMDRIGRAQSQVYQTRLQIDETVLRLQQISHQADSDRASRKAELDALILRA